jgi:tripartite-type tricarboxylate transporter receptor subunit TctC
MPWLGSGSRRPILEILMRKLAIAIMIAALLSALPATAQDFFRGKTIKLIAGSAVGASYDSYARLVASHMPRHIPGEPKIIVQNVPGAGGLLAANTLYNLAERNGATMGVLNRSTVLASIIGNEQARYKSEDFNWLGTAASFDDNAYLFVIRAALPYKTLEDLRTAATPVHVGNSGSPLISLLKYGLALNLKLIEGYGRTELDLAFERGEVDGIGIAYANLVARHPDWLGGGFIRPLVQFGRTERFAAFPDVPTAREAARNPEERGLIELAEASLRVAYPFALPPMVPPDRVSLVRRAFAATMIDPAYRDDVQRGRLDYSPKSAEEVQAMIASIAKMPASIIARYKEVIRSNQSGG